MGSDDTHEDENEKNKLQDLLFEKEKIPFQEEETKITSVEDTSDGIPKSKPQEEHESKVETKIEILAKEVDTGKCTLNENPHEFEKKDIIDDMKDNEYQVDSENVNDIDSSEIEPIIE